MPEPEFEKFPSIARLMRNCVITEKIDGTNSVVHVSNEGVVTAGSRSRWLSHESKKTDNFGFARWVHEHEDELRTKLGIGYHYGEWWGVGIQRRYGMDEKRWSLFNVARWADPDVRPSCCHVVPVLFEGPFDTMAIQATLATLRVHGSQAAPGFMNPEGVIVYHEKARQLFKYTLGGDGHKGATG